MAAASEPASSPQRIGRYEIVGPLGSGGMGEVFRARTVGPAEVERFVALKRVRSDLASDPEFVHRFVEEARLAARLVHPSLVTVLDFGRSDGSYFLALELVDGLDVGHAMKSGGPMPPALVAHVLRRVALGLAFLHDPTPASGAGRAVVHGDVKPANVLLGRAGVVKLTDLGVARALGPTGMGTTRAGTARYMSPERLAGSAATPADDVYALGLVGLAMLTAAHPEPQGAETSGDSGRDRLSTVAASRWPALSAFFELCLAADPARRGNGGLVLPSLDRAARELAGDSETAPETALAVWLEACLPPTSTDETPSRTAGTPDAGSTELSRLETADLESPPPQQADMAAEPVPRVASSPVFRGSVLAGIAVVVMAVLGVLFASPDRHDHGATSAANAPGPLTPLVSTAAPLSGTPVSLSARATPAPVTGSELAAPSSTSPRPASTSAAAHRGFGFLSISTPGTWANVSVAGRTAVTPAKLRLPAGRHVVKLHNPELGVHKELVVTVRAGAEVTELVELGAP